MLQTRLTDLCKYTDAEADVNRHILLTLKSDRKGLLDKIKELKGVLRTPRLYTLYRNKIEDIAHRMDRGLPIKEGELDVTVDKYAGIFGNYSNDTSLLVPP